MKNNYSNYDIVLASNSPRRQQFFKELEIPFRVETYSVEEVFPSNLQSFEISNFLVMLKASSFKEIAENQIIITADTIVWSDEMYLGKPKDRNEAKKMLQQLSGKTHQVISSVAFTQAYQQNIIHEISEVTFRKLKEEEIDYYIENYQPLDKAGAYGIQEWIGNVAVEKIVGSYTNIVGLPVSQMLLSLERLIS